MYSNKRNERHADSTQVYKQRASKSNYKAVNIFTLY